MGPAVLNYKQVRTFMKIRKWPRLSYKTEIGSVSVSMFSPLLVFTTLLKAWEGLGTLNYLKLETLNNQLIAKNTFLAIKQEKIDQSMGFKFLTKELINKEAMGKCFICICEKYCGGQKTLYIFNTYMLYFSHLFIYVLSP